MEWLASYTDPGEGSGVFKKLVLKGEDGNPLCNLVAVKKKPAAVSAAEKGAKALSVANQMKQPAAVHNAKIVAATATATTAAATETTTAMEATMIEDETEK